MNRMRRLVFRAASIRVRLTLWYVALLAVILVLFSGALYLSLSRSLRQEMDLTLSTEAERLIAGIEFGGGALHLIRSEVAHAIVAMWTAAGELAGWYVNLQAPVRRSPTGFDTMDQVLDLVVLPDLTTWWWKDEDELDLAVELGVFTREEAGAIRAEGERVAALIDSGTPPFDPAWADWTPDPAWGRPELPDGWRSPDGRGTPGP